MRRPRRPGLGLDVVFPLRVLALLLVVFLLVSLSHQKRGILKRRHPHRPLSAGRKSDGKTGDAQELHTAAAKFASGFGKA